MTEKVKVRIDGEVIPASVGQTILEVARASSVYIPALCYMEGLSAVGACRLCMVEISGVGRLQPACTTPVQEGLAVVTTSPQLQSYRKIALELLFSERNHICAVCVSSGHCELQTLAQENGVTHVRYPYSFPRLAVDTSHPRYVLDHNRCILCSRCVRACAEIEGAHVWNVAGRGIRSLLVSELKRPWGEATTCTTCGKCVQACPTGAMAEKGWGVE
ncbi:MAG TPA: bidirectional hydrogenase complex protein HoxU, partial [Chthonomonadales bacterium]|nr:bidirectional hydrogenase complex protein HoxU [Chthonomonadales bacterium]